MEVYKRPDGLSPWWQVDYVHPVTGKRVRTSLKVKGTKAEAQKVAAKLLQEIHRKGDDHDMTLREALEAYCTALDRDGKVSAQGQRALAQKCLQGGPEGSRFKLRGDMQLASVTPRVLEALATARHQEGNSPQTVAHEIKLLRAAYRYASGLGAAVNPKMTDGSVDNSWRMPALPQKTRHLTMEEFKRVYDHLSPLRTIVGRSDARYQLPTASRAYRQLQDAQDLLVALTMCGGRWSEVSSLSWDRVDLNRGVIRIWGNKTQAERLVGIPTLMLSMLRRRRSSSTGPLVFPVMGNKQRAGSCRAIGRAMDACGLNVPEAVAQSGRATIHSLRHTYASLLLQNGASLADIQDALGHTSLAMTRRYAHLAKGESAAKLAGIMSRVAVIEPGSTEPPAPVG